MASVPALEWILVQQLLVPHRRDQARGSTGGGGAVPVPVPGPQAPLCPWGLTHLLQGITCFPSVSAAPGLRLLSASTRGGTRWGHSGHYPQGGKQGPSGSWVVALTSLMATVRDEACCQGCPRATCVKPTCLILAGEAYLLHPAVNDPNQLAYLEVRKG